MKTFHLSSLLLCTVAGAQPGSFTDLGVLLPPRSIALEPAIVPREVLWYRFDLPALADLSGWLDVYTVAGSAPLLTGEDSVLALYNAAGQRVGLDDNDGPARYSALSFGVTSPVRPAVGSSFPFNGRDGALPAGRYYLALSASPTDYGLTGWSGSSRATSSGNVSLHLEAGCTLCPVPPRFVAASGTPPRVYRGSPALIRVGVVAGDLPPSVSYSVTANATALGGPAALELFDNGQGGDEFAGDLVFSATMVVGSATTSGPLNVPVWVVDDQARSGTGSLPLVVGPEGEWNERTHGGGDAGEGTPDAQAITAPGVLTAIAGTVGASDADIFVIRIDNPAQFSASTEGTGQDTQLFLFDACTGLGVVASDDTDVGTVLWSRLSGRYLSRPGYYLLAITGFDRDPFDAQQASIWSNSPIRGEVTPVPGAGPLWYWERSGTGFDYVITLSGCLGVPAAWSCQGPCPADFDGSGEVNPDDLGDFITCYFSESPCLRADFNGDGEANPDDLGDFITTYFSAGSICLVPGREAPGFPGFLVAFGGRWMYL